MIGSHTNRNDFDTRKPVTRHTNLTGLMRAGRNALKRPVYPEVKTVHRNKRKEIGHDLNNCKLNIQN